MRTTSYLVLAAMAAVGAAAAADSLPIARLAGASFKVADLEKTRKFYTGMLGLEEAFDLKDACGAIQSAFFKVNDDQYLEFQPAAVENFQLLHFSLLIADLKQAAAELRKRGVEPGAISKSADGNAYFAVKDPEGAEIHFVRFMPGSQETEQRGKALGAGASPIGCSTSVYRPTTMTPTSRSIPTSSAFASCFAAARMTMRSGGSISPSPASRPTFWSS